MRIVFTRHAKTRIEIRKISKEEIITAIQQPDTIIKKHNKHYYQKKLNRGTIELVCEKTESNINIITVYWV